jgi:hypothetical protein
MSNTIKTSINSSINTSINSAVNTTMGKTVSASRPLHPSISAAAVAGWIGGALAWFVTSAWTDLSSVISSYTRLDQFAALVLGAFVGGLVLTVRARHRREPLLPAARAGLLLGGVSALLGATVSLLFDGATSSEVFVVQRVLTWALLSGSAAAALATYTRPRRTPCIVESGILGLIGGATAGAMYSLPGPAEIWLPVAMTWSGGAIGFAAVGPAMWRAMVVVQVLPPRDGRLSLWSLHERAIDRGGSMPVAEGEVGCVDDDVVVSPPPAGAILDGYPLYRALPLTRDAILAIGRSRFRLTVGRRA